MKEFFEGIGCLLGCLVKLAVLAVVIGAVIAVIIAAQVIFLPDAPQPSPTYDCDDNTLYLYHHFHNLGFEVKPIVGNLSMTNETFKQSNHVWILVKIGDEYIPYDWGGPYIDKQHYEGYFISYKLLLKAVERDR